MLCIVVALSIWIYGIVEYVQGGPYEVLEQALIYGAILCGVAAGLEIRLRRRDLDRQQRDEAAQRAQQRLEEGLERKREHQKSDGRE